MIFENFASFVLLLDGKPLAVVALQAGHCFSLGCIRLKTFWKTPRFKTYGVF